jgi:hypothetical protein
MEKAMSKQAVNVKRNAPLNVKRFRRPLISPKTKTPHKEAISPGVEVTMGKVIDSGRWLLAMNHPTMATAQSRPEKREGKRVAG